MQVADQQDNKMACDRVTAIASRLTPTGSGEIPVGASLLAMWPVRTIKVHRLKRLPSTGALRCNETLALHRSQ